MLPLAGGYALSLDDAEAWALRNCPGIKIYNKNYLPSIITSHSRRCASHLKNIRASAALIDLKLVGFFPVLSMPVKNTRSMRPIPEDKRARDFKALLFSHKDDKELAEKTQWITIIDPDHEMHVVWAERHVPPSAPHPDYEDYQDVDYVDETDETVQGSGST